MIAAPLLLRLGIGAIAVVATCVLAIYQVKKQRAALAAAQQVPQFDGSNIKQCPICLDQLGGVRGSISLPCKHKFHKSCIRNVFNVQPHNCPICRRTVDSTFVQTVLQA